MQRPLISRTVLAVVLWVAVAGPYARPAWSAPKPSPKAVSDDKTYSDVAKEERWVAHLLDDEVERAGGAKQREALAKRLSKAALAWAGCGRLDQLSTPVALLHALRDCKYLPLLEDARDEASRDLATWLLAHREVRRVLLRAMEDVPSPKKALEAFRELQAAHPDKVVEYPDLAAAFATARPMRDVEPLVTPATMLESFQYYTDPKRKFRFSPRKLPFELSRYLADTRISIEERTWAAQRYARTRNLGPTYFDVKYDHGFYRDNTPKKISELPYTLQNLLKVGGVCIDQAYYACQVAKSLGVPSAIVTGKGISGMGHAWFTYFQMNPAATDASWSGGAGRYSSQLYFTGQVTDPATGEGILDSELVLLGSATLLPLRRREEAETAVLIAKLAAEACADANVPADPTPLKDLAADYEKRLAPQPGAAKLDVSWLRAKRAIDRSLVEDLVGVAIQRNLAYTPSWELIIELRKADRLPAQGLDRFFNVLISKTGMSFPELSCQMIMQLVPTIPDAAKRESTYKRALALYGMRPDLRGNILLALGGDYQKAGDDKKALQMYQVAALQCIQVPDIAIPAAEKAEEILLAQDQPKVLLKMYYTLFGSTRKEMGASDELRKRTPNYKFGLRLAELLRAAGKGDMADKIVGGL